MDHIRPIGNGNLTYMDTLQREFTNTFPGNRTLTTAFWSGNRIRSTSPAGDMDHNRCMSSGHSIFLLGGNDRWPVNVARATLVHELAHQFDARDHYCEEGADGRCISRGICSECGPPDTQRSRDCIMYTITSLPTHREVFCAGCRSDILRHLRSHHRIR